ncbi:MAG: hypothetical protein FD181_1835 [Prolixibacteraceae bacterium]|nr:MAG: hypothetical protein FD181_1835 [Prolixibacteraceae bacterium]
MRKTYAYGAPFCGLPIPGGTGQKEPFNLKLFKNSLTTGRQKDLTSVSFLFPETAGDAKVRFSTELTTNSISGKTKLKQNSFFTGTTQLPENQLQKKNQ